eukprot:1744428-Karenia_brevis.AAC.1
MGSAPQLEFVISRLPDPTKLPRLLWTQIAELYPKPLCTVFAKHLIAVADEVVASNLCRICGLNGQGHA